jgi:hypothetical protein
LQFLASGTVSAFAGAEMKWKGTLMKIGVVGGSGRWFCLPVIQCSARYRARNCFGIGMVSARIAEIVSRHERVVIPIGSYNPKYGVTLSMPSVPGQTSVVQILKPAMSTDEQQALRGAVKGAATRLQG